MSEITTVGLIGDPVAHSLSPAMHNAALRAFAVAEQYALWQTPVAELSARVQQLRKPPMRGANVTLPHKVAIVPLLDRCVDVAHELGAVNTIVREPDQMLTGHNTDAPALRDSLLALGIDGATTQAVILGAGGAARATLWALRQLNCRSITLVNRDLARAKALIRANEHALSADDPQVAQAISAASLLINATSLGWHASDPAPCDLQLLHSQLLVYDLVYRLTPFLQAAQACGAVTSDGFDMLVRQAGLAFELWFKRPAPLDIMRSAVSAVQGA